MSGRWALAPIVALLLLAGPAQAQRSYQQFGTVDSYFSSVEEVRDAYVAGIADALVAFRLAPRSLEECLAQLRVREMRSAFERWFRRNPDDVQFSLPTVFVDALTDYCRNPVPW